MPERLSLYGQFVVVSLKSQMQYRASFLFSALGQFLANGIEIVGIWALFERFGSLSQWTLPQVALFYGVVHCAFAIADALSTGFDQFSMHIRTGEFDRLLLRPRGTVLQLMGQELALRRVGRLAQGLMVLVCGILEATGIKIALAQIGDEQREVIIIQLKATLQSAVGHPPLALQEGNRLRQNLIKLHARFPPPKAHPAPCHP